MDSLYGATCLFLVHNIQKLLVSQKLQANESAFGIRPDSAKVTVIMSVQAVLADAVNRTSKHPKIAQRSWVERKTVLSHILFKYLDTVRKLPPNRHLWR